MTRIQRIALRRPHNGGLMQRWACAWHHIARSRCASPPHTPQGWPAARRDSTNALTDPAPRLDARLLQSCAGFLPGKLGRNAMLREAWPHARRVDIVGSMAAHAAISALQASTGSSARVFGRGRRYMVTGLYPGIT